jgi:hypothetical protein
MTEYWELNTITIYCLWTPWDVYVVSSGTAYLVVLGTESLLPGYYWSPEAYTKISLKTGESLVSGYNWAREAYTKISLKNWEFLVPGYYWAREAYTKISLKTGEYEVLVSSPIFSLWTRIIPQFRPAVQDRNIILHEVRNMIPDVCLILLTRSHVVPRVKLVISFTLELTRNGFLGPSRSPCVQMLMQVLQGNCLSCMLNVLTLCDFLWKW